MPEKPVTLTYRQTLQMRRNYVGRSCKLHFEVAPLKIVRASRQYLYDDTGNEFLDCINNVSHVGHCHPHVVSAGQTQMAMLTTCAGFLNDQMAEYAKRLISTLPDKLCVCFFVNSGSEANDLSLRLARSYTKREDVIVLENAYHGNLGNLIEISPLKFKKLNMQKKDWVHIAPCPDTYRGKYREGEVPNPSLSYSNEVKQIIEEVQDQGRGIAAFMCEPLMSASGIVTFPKNYLQNVYRHVRENGGVCLADEVQTGLGRTGENFWAFQSHDVVPDIVSIGKPIGNGHPMAVVITTKEIADTLVEFGSTFGGNPVSCAVGMAVLDVIQNEMLISSAKSVGKCLLDGFRAILPHHSMMGDVRGQGMIIGVELVMDKESKKPAKEAAEILCYRAKEQNIILANDGPGYNVIVLTPPLCFNCDNARRVIQVFDSILKSIETEAASVGLTSSGIDMNQSETGDVPITVISGTLDRIHQTTSDDDDGCSDEKRARYEEMD
ncbi:hypothetical protein SNE40_023622 [Patella caerulea]|uniref:Alanine-glyoxylate aminotransferase n=1 Tax=Patella caerulea TaxID=87958 RepID=A0AAN8IUM9_PATCE